MNILAIFEGPVEAGDHGDVLGVPSEGLHGGGQLEIVYPGLVFQSLLVLDLVCFKASDETGQFGVLLTWEEASSDQSIGDIHDDQFLGRFLDDGRGEGRNRG